VSEYAAERIRQLDVSRVPASAFSRRMPVSRMGSLLLDVPVRQRVAGTRALALPLALALALALFLFLDSVRQNAALTWTFAGAAAVLLAWNAALLASAVRRGRTLGVEIVLRKQHYLQACIQGSLLVYWGWYWRQVYDSAHLIAAQLLFAYAFDMLLSWSRRDVYALGFGPFPVVFSMNLFLWFKPDWFYMQLLMVAVGFAAKELIRWDKGGRSVHIFNPSSFPLAVFSLALIVTHTSDLTWGQDIATTLFYPPHMYLALFLFALPGQYLFGVTTMTMSAVVTTYLFGLLYYATTGIYFFYDSYIPIAVFLGMHLLFTDPATSPRTDLGRVIFGVLYGISTIALYALLGKLGLPTFYDKLLQIPILNLSIKLIDRLARSNALQRIDPTAIVRPLTPRQRHLAYMSVWAMVFAVMSAVQGVGDSHPGQWLPFWQQACAEGRPYACSYLEGIMSSDCDRGSIWACEELAILQDRSDRYRPRTLASATAEDYPIILRGAKGPLRDVSRAGLEALACREGWPGTCDQRR
jgi:hypothetical protein